MSDTAATLIKITSALTSPQACIKYISIGLFILITLVWVEPALVDLKLSKDRLTIALSFIGVGTGALIGHILSTIYDKLHKRYKANIAQKKAKEDEQNQLNIALDNLNKTNEIILEKIKDSFSHLSYWQKQTLRHLTISERTLISNDEDIQPLKANNFILQKVHIKDSKYLFKINPAIENFIKTQWETEMKENVDEFLSNESSSDILEVLKTCNQKEPKKIINSSILDTLSQCTVPIKGEFIHRFDTFRFTFEYGYHEYLENRLSESYLNQLTIGKDQISFNTYNIIDS
ncbi:hypothetical protein E5N72_18675 [Pseudoalteromonas sp. MEBiC 03607]|uniref:hypothetical protein n=1 Tax=Pseudoalteromonas sp. MEBiC 03607 TaxID=2563601 RepID=UPI00109406CC|nr:hypothetical protein [Pseudoalteromonas sp. MEBiC 03607]TGV17251.1 hypothetical protein E5N72_18675 [Pseudoalteromonas sp. MEBiC 03607]